MGDGTFRKRARRGMALATSLMLSVLILVLGMSLLTTSQHDLAFQRQQRARDRAELLAQSGLEHVDYLMTRDPSQFDTTNVPLDPAEPKKYHVVQDVEYFTLSQKEESIGGRKVLLVEGVVESSNPETAARRTIAVPFGPDNSLLRSEIATQAFHK